VNRNVLRAAVAIAVAWAMVLLVPDGKAAADPIALMTYSDQTASDPTEAKEASVSCPDNGEVLSGGAYVVGGDRRVHIVRSQPSPSNNGWLAGARTGPGEEPTGNWRLHVYVMCGLHVRMDQGFVGDTQVVTFHTAANSDASNEISAPCPRDRVVVSAGGRISGGDGEVVLDDLYIESASNSVRVRGVEVEGGSANMWSVWAFAVCAKPSSLPGYEVVDNDPISTTGDKGQWLHCPDEMVLVGYGTAMVGANGHAHFTQIEPKIGSAAVESIVDETGSPAPWHLQIQAVCVYPYGGR
jgi:hypothetical protein